MTAYNAVAYFALIMVLVAAVAFTGGVITGEKEAEKQAEARAAIFAEPEKELDPIPAADMRVLLRFRDDYEECVMVVVREHQIRRDNEWVQQQKKLSK